MDSKSFNIRVPKRWARSALAIAVVALIAAPLTAVASHTFDDVPSSNTFHTDIEWLADAGVTKGCNPPANTNYCPDDDVTRGQMSAFMRRLAENQVVDAGELDGRDATAYQTLVVADGCEVKTLTTTSCGDGTAPDQTTVELARVTLDAPADGTLVLSGYTFGNTSNWFTLNQSCAAYDFLDTTPIIEQAVNGTLFGGLTEVFGSASTAISVASGSQTVRVCGAYEGDDDAGALFSASLTATWTAGGDVSISDTAAAMTTPMSSEGTLLGS